MFCCTLLYIHSSIAIILMGKRELIALLNLSSWCLVMVELLFLAVQRGYLQFVIVVFPDHTHLPLFKYVVAVSRAHRGLSVGFLLLRYSVLFTVESLSSPETLLESYREIMLQLSKTDFLKTIFVDEAHCIKKL